MGSQRTMISIRPNQEKRVAEIASQAADINMMRGLLAGAAAIFENSNCGGFKSDSHKAQFIAALKSAAAAPDEEPLPPN